MLQKNCNPSIVSSSCILPSDHLFLSSSHLSLSLTCVLLSFITNLNLRVNHYNDSFAYTFNSVYPFLSHSTLAKASSLLLCLHLYSNHIDWSHFQFTSIMFRPLRPPSNPICWHSSSYSRSGVENVFL